MTTSSHPTRAEERIQTLDIVRGFALLGIFIMNMPGFSTSFYAEANGSRLWSDPLNHYAELVRDMLFSGKFNSMFSLLFGLGFTLQLGRMMADDPQHATGLYVRRLLVLAAFALLHVMVFWNGDVLHIYVVLGFCLLGLRHLSNRAIVGLIIATLVYPPVSGLIRLAVMPPEVVAQLVADAQAWEKSNNLAYGHGSFAVAAGEHTREFVHTYGTRWQLWGTFGFYVQMTTTMLIGFLIGRNGWVRRIPELMPKIRTLQWWALGLGLACSLGFGIIGEFTRTPGPSPLKILRGLCYIFSRLGLMSFYVLSIVRLAQLPAWQRRFAPMAAAGRMPLTNYLLQTLMATSLFYGWGLGLWGQVGPAAELLLAPVLFFCVQVPLSMAWLRRHDYGPLEYVWRLLTYGRRPGSAVAVERA
ncbi:DUF418 domain-containing protein [Pelomonas sp. SE-A7]|uniref:DUF418 domain-containing protein n=1 Tax=Pelomonas sp. SE-A7 TaxID=3054953 RepID=UPI00259C7B72|nr:DUF418 domain-containing protein [Pelomonas sp. SE-A7]MDM4766921.1 DUF418 domain-containing protein [Pelomonas sp. SE-A7]